MLAVISDYVGALLTVLSSILFAKIILKTKMRVNNLSLLLFSIIFAFVLQSLYFLNITTIKTFLAFLVVSFLFKFVFGLDIVKSLMLGVCHFIIEILSDMITIFFLSLILGKEQFYGVVAGSLISNLIVIIIMLIMSIIFRKFILKFLSIKIKHQVIFMTILSLLCIISIFFVTFELGANSVDNLLGFLSLVVITIILVNTFIQVYKNNQLMIEYDNLLEFIKKYEIEIDNQRIIRHEAKNQLLTIKSKIIDNESNEDVIRYIDEVINDKKKVKHSEYARFKSLPSNGIKGLFYFKVSLAQDKKIKVSVNISDNLSQSRLGNLNSSLFNQIGKILGVYLDNAIEGAELSKKKIMGIEIYEENNRIIFIISNSYDSSIQKIGRSSKGIGRGYGLLLVGNIINANKNLSTETEITDNLYVKRLIIKE